MLMNMHTYDYLYWPKSRINDFFNIRRSVRNWWDVIFFKLGIKDSVAFHLRNNKMVKIGSRKEYSDFFTYNHDSALDELRRSGLCMSVGKKYVNFLYNGRRVRFTRKGAPLIATIGLLKETFAREEYAALDVKGKVVIDIGASLGDTPIYFALRGAKHVYAFEPFYPIYRVAKENIRINNLEGRITLLNAGVGSRDGRLEDVGDTVGILAPKGRKGKDAAVMGLNSVLRRFGIDEAALKSDCEGCEYDFIMNSKKEMLRRFSGILLEYHDGYLNLERKLDKCGFKRTFNRRSVYDRKVGRLIGMLFAERED